MQKFLILIAVVITLSLSTFAADAAVAVTVDAVKTTPSVQATRSDSSIEYRARNAVNYQLKGLIKALIGKKQYAEALFVGQTYGLNVISLGMTTTQIREGLDVLELEWRPLDRADMAKFRLMKSGNAEERQKALDAGFQILNRMAMRNQIAAMLPDDELPPAIIVKKKTK
ncbi:MAG: hypothetical protein WCI57_02320 [Candidatus Berkelbacteria bacterium]